MHMVHVYDCHKAQKYKMEIRCQMQKHAARYGDLSYLHCVRGGGEMYVRLRRSGGANDKISAKINVNEHMRTDGEIVRMQNARMRRDLLEIFCRPSESKARRCVRVRAGHQPCAIPGTW